MLIEPQEMKSSYEVKTMIWELCTLGLYARFFSNEWSTTPGSGGTDMHLGQSARHALIMIVLFLV